jgi:hypothetical protein
VNPVGVTEKLPTFPVILVAFPVLVIAPALVKIAKPEVDPKLIDCPKIAFGIKNSKTVVNVKSNFVFILIILMLLNEFQLQCKGKGMGYLVCYTTILISCIIHTISCNWFLLTKKAHRKSAMGFHFGEISYS